MILENLGKVYDDFQNTKRFSIFSQRKIFFILHFIYGYKTKFTMNSHTYHFKEEYVLQNFAYTIFSEIFDQ